MLLSKATFITFKCFSIHAIPGNPHDLGAASAVIFSNGSHPVSVSSVSKCAVLRGLREQGREPLIYSLSYRKP